MSDLLQIGASGAAAYRNALGAVGENIVNAETPGYARRSVTFKESALSSGTNPLYRDNANFGGVETRSVERAWDDFKAADARLSGAVAGRSDARVRWLGAVEQGLDDGQNGVGQRLTAMFTSAEALASDPGNNFARRAFLTAIDGAAGAFRVTADALDRTSAGIAGEAETTIASINADLAAVSSLNVQMRRVGPNTAAGAALADERDRLLDQISDSIEIDVTLFPDGTATATLPRSGGLVMFDRGGVAPAELSLTRAADGRLAVGLFSQGVMNSVTTAAGVLGGLVEVAGIVTDRRAQLNALATGFATALNGWSAAGVDKDGVAGTALVTVDPADPAASIAPAIANRDPATVAAALSVDNGDGTFTVTANGNALALSALRGENGTEASWDVMVASQSQILASAKSEQTTSTARRDGAYAARDQVIGVDLDFEASELLRFQQAYGAAAKIIQIARETMQTIMEVL